MKNDRLKSILGIPYFLFLVIFVVCPVLILLYYAFTNGAGEFSSCEFTLFLSDSKAIGTLIYSVMVAVVTTIVCLLIAYPVAYLLAKGRIPARECFINVICNAYVDQLTLRITALKEILTLIEGNLAFHPFLNTVIGMTYDFLPFMILPIYNTIAKIDHSYIEAAKDLGAKSYRVFLRVILPLSIPGIISGITMVFLPSMTNYVVLDMMYNSTYIMGSLVGSYFSMYDWNNGSVISMILLILILLLSTITGEFSDKEDNAYE